VARLRDERRRAEDVVLAKRLRDVREALAAHDLQSEPALVRHTLMRAADAYETTRELPLGPHPPTAVFTSQNLIAVDAVRALHDLGLQHRVALVGFDDVALTDVVEPDVTVIAQDPASCIARSRGEDVR
jgi:LacI family transcriptional regulator